MPGHNPAGQLSPAGMAAWSDLPWPQAVETSDTIGSTILTSTACLLMGWAVLEESGSAPFEFHLYNGTNASGHKVATVGNDQLRPNVLAVGWPGIACPDGLYLDLAAGSWRGAVWFIPVIGGLE